MSDKTLSNNINNNNIIYNEEIVETNDNVVKEEDISNVVPVNSEDAFEWA